MYVRVRACSIFDSRNAVQIERILWWKNICEQRVLRGERYIRAGKLPACFETRPSIYELRRFAVKTQLYAAAQKYVDECVYLAFLWNSRRVMCIIMLSLNSFTSALPRQSLENVGISENE